METTKQADPMETLTAVPVSLRRLTELTRMLREQLPPAMERLEDGTLTLKQTAEDLSQAGRALTALAAQVREEFARLGAKAEIDLTRLTAHQQKTLTAYSRGVTVLLVSQALLIVVTVLTLWLRR
jgi:CHASE3 domain sensor protein